MAIVGIRDTIRKEVPDAVLKCKKAGITVRMVTGDNKMTALAIAKECFIIDSITNIEPDSVMEGKDFWDRMGGIICKTCGLEFPKKCKCKDKADPGVGNLAEFKKIKNSLKILARSRPDDKYLLVTGLK